MNSVSRSFHPDWRTALWLVFAIAGLSAGPRVIAQQATPPAAPNGVYTPVPPPVTLPGPPAPQPGVSDRPFQRRY